MQSRYVIIAGITIILVGLISYLPLINQKIITGVLRANGFTAATIDGFYFTPHGIQIDTINLSGDGKTIIEHVTAKGSWRGILLKQQFDMVSIKNINVAASVAADHTIYIAGLKSNAQKKSVAPFVIRPLPVNAMTIERVNFNITTPAGAAHLQSHLSLQTKGEMQIFDAALKGDQPLLTIEAAANGNLSKDGAWSLKTDIKNLQTETGGFSALRGSGRFEIASHGTVPHFVFQLTAPSLQNIVDDFSDKTKPTKPIFNSDVPVTIHLETSPQNFSSPLPLNFQTKIEFPTIPLSFEIPSVYNGKTINFAVPKTVIDSSAAARIIDLTPYNIYFTAGNFDAGGAIEVTLTPLSIRGPLTVSAHELEGLLSDYNFKNLSSRMEFSSLLPLATNGSQKIIVETLETGLPLEKISGTLNITPETGVVLESLTASAAGGTITSTPISFKNPQSITSVINLNHLNLKYLFAKEGSDISAEGLFSGRLPITFNDKGLQINGGLISNNGDGILRYTPSVVPSFMAGDDERMKTVRLALSDYRFDSMSLAIDGSMDGDLKTSLKMNGKNPAFDERPVKLNLNIEGALVPAIKQALQPSALSDKIKKEIAKGTR